MRKTAIEKENALAKKIPTDVGEAYNVALESFRVAAQKFRLAQHAYRAREIGDAEFLAARAEYDKADVASDVAYNNLQAAYARARANPRTGFIKDPVLEAIRTDKK